MKIDQHHFNAESELMEFPLNHDFSIIPSSLKIDSLLDEFVGELTLLKSIPPGINETDCHPENEIRLTKRLLYDNSSPRPPEEFVSENSNPDIESFSPSPIPVKDSDSFMEEIDLSYTPEDPMPPGIEDEDYDSERDILIHWDTSAQRSESSSSITSSFDMEIAALKAEMAEINKNLMRVLQVNQQVKAVTPSCKTCGGPHSYTDCPATVGQTQNVYAAGAYQAYQAPTYQAPGYQALVHQHQIPQPQVVTTNEFTNFMKANDANLKNMQTNMTSLTNSNLELKNMFGQFMKKNTDSSLGLRTLPGNTVTNPKEELKGITTCSGTAYQGPTIPTTSSSLPQVVERNYLPQVRKELKICEAKTDKSSIDEPLKVELKDLPPHLEYVFLEGDGKFPVIIAKDLSDEEKTALITVLKSHKRAIAWKLFDIKGIDPELYTHKILMEGDFKPVVQHQRRVNPKIYDVIKNEGGFTVVENEENELIPIRLVTGWRVCIDYRKFNEATRKDHFPLPFRDQMPERLAGNEYYCFLDGFLGYIQIPINPKDQEKTTFTCHYGTFAYRRMPFGLCNALGTF
uniref:Reverse transcriptase domain-containing protein n=1 Tax=Tanacetum cinerariifolium TaxID=118510 RepID=A0A6L2KA44_TANCI|nr:reverse transcriptase domain-containing protein [Tanacetum cinerariifolium]